MKKQMKYLKHTIARYVYSHCNITIYFCNMYIKHLQHTSKTSETLKIYTCNMCFQQTLAGGRVKLYTARSGTRSWWRRMEPRRCEGSWARDRDGDEKRLGPTARGREEGGRRVRVWCRGAAWRGAGMGRTEEGCWERRLGGRCGHHGCGDEENCEMNDWARRKRNTSIPFF
jgi:hypothetical protein